MVMAIALVHESLSLIGFGEIISFVVGGFELAFLLGKGPLVGTEVGLVLALQPEQGGKQGGFFLFDVGQKRRDVFNPRINSSFGEDQDVFVVSSSLDILTVVSVQWQATVSEAWENVDVVPCRPPQEVEEVFHVGFVERRCRLIVSGDAGVDLATSDDKDAHCVIARLAQNAEHRLGLFRVVVRLGGLGIAVEGCVITTQADVIEPFCEEPLVGFLEDELRPLFAWLDDDAL